MKQPSTEKKKYTAKTKSGGNVDVTAKSKSDAASGSGAWKGRGSYKGRTSTDKYGKLSGITTHAGKYMATPGPVARKAAKKIMDRDRKLFVADSTAIAQRNTRVAEAKPKERK